MPILQAYAMELDRRRIISQDLIQQMFPNLANILDFQRRFLIRLETTFDQTPSEQRWGQEFVDCVRSTIGSEAAP
jgi:cell division control protein 24